VNKLFEEELVRSYKLRNEKLGNRPLFVPTSGSFLVRMEGETYRADAAHSAPSEMDCRLVHADCPRDFKSVQFSIDPDTGRVQSFVVYEERDGRHGRRFAWDEREGCYNERRGGMVMELSNVT
jgi:hypothetical protein